MEFEEGPSSHWRKVEDDRGNTNEVRVSKGMSNLLVVSWLSSDEVVAGQQEARGN